MLFCCFLQAVGPSLQFYECEMLNKLVFVKLFQMEVEADMQNTAHIH